jgi:hypothetical protein
MSQLVGGRKHFDNLDFERAVEQARRAGFSELAKGSICEPASR